MPDFTIRGNPSAVRSRATTMADKGQLFYETGDGLAKIDTSGWIGRAADAFREAHDLEPDRWYKAGNGFQKAAAALQTYAGELESAQSVAEWAEGEHARGDAETERAQGQYGSYLDRMRSYWASGGTDLAEPFVDSGEAVRQNAITELDAAKARLDNAAHLCAGQVREGCADAPEEPEWWESGLRFVGGIFEGAGEAVWDLLTMVPFSPVNLVIDSYNVATGDLTPEELVKKYELAGESAVDMAQGIYTGLTTDPVGFGKNLGKSLLDWDTWADDPARAIGHLVPDAVVAAATAGTGALATRGVTGGMDALDALSDMSKLRHLDDLDALGGLSRLDDLGDTSRVYSMMDDVPHRTTFAPDQLGSSRIDGVLDHHGVSRDDFIDLVNRPAADLTDAQRSILGSVRDDLPAPTSDTVMQKVIDQPFVDEHGNVQWGGADNYVQDRYAADEVRGAVTVADDTSHLGSPRDINEHLRLDYGGTHHSPEDTSTHVIRFQTDDPNFEVPLNGDMTGTPNKFDSWSDPFTGNGFTKSGDDIIPEYVTDGPTRIREGAEMWEVTDGGSQRLVAVLRNQDGEPSWIPQGN